MIRKDQYLHNDVFSGKLERQYLRNGFGEGLVEAGEINRDVVVLCADLAESTRTHWFKEKFPKRYIEMGVAEQNMATVASGMAAAGKVPFMTSYAAFNPGRNWEQIRTTIALNEMPVKVVGSHAGVSVGPDGATHQALEDIALMRVIPGMTVIVPADYEEAKKATVAAAEFDGPVYLRLVREKTPAFTTEKSPFEIGKANLLYRPATNIDVGIVTTGPLTYNALLAAKELTDRGTPTAVLNFHTIKPFDIDALLDLAQMAGALVTVEEHQTSGGLAGIVSEVLAQTIPTPLETIGVHDQFGQSGKPEELIAHYEMNVASIIEAVRRVKDRKIG